MLSYRAFLRKVVLYLVLILLAVASLSYVVDPYGVNWLIVRRGFNQNKGMFSKGVRLAKVYYLPVLKPHAILTGTSRAEYGLDPENPKLAAWKPVYNYALTAGNFYELRRYIEHAVRHTDVRTVVLGLDLLSFGAMKNSPDFDEERLVDFSLLRKAKEAYLSWSAVYGTFGTIKKNIKYPDEAKYLRNGWHTPYKQDRAVAKGRTTLKREFEKSEGKYLRISYYRFALNNDRINDFRETVALCREKGITLHCFISPSHARQWEVLRRAGLWPTWEQWKRELAAIAPVWDFSGYNSVTVIDRNYLDSSHYRSEVGDLVLARMLGKDGGEAPADFGLLLYGGNMEEHLGAIRQSRERWAATHQQDIEDIARLHREAEAGRSNGKNAAPAD